MTPACARFFVALCLIAMLPACSHAGRTRRTVQPRPVLERVDVRGCRDVAGVRWCDVTITPLLMNDEALKHHVMMLEAELGF